jgi:chromosome partitioning protein
MYVTASLREGVTMSVLTVATQKGGAGKTLICQALASLLAVEMQVVAIDADHTGALSRWASRAYEGASFETVAEADETRLAHLIAAKADIADLVLVDTAGFGNRAATVAMTSADAVLVPSLVGEADITEAERTVGLVVALARAARRDIPVRVLMNRLKRTTLARHASAEMIAAGLPRLNSTLSDLVAYGELTYSGRLADKGTAHLEVAALIKELQTLDWLPKKASLRKGVAV